MELIELKQLVDLSIEDCQQIINQNPKVILSEGDFEKLLSECISKRIGYVKEKPTPDSFAVYTQISHYKNISNKNDARVDILLMKPDDIVYSFDEPNKRFLYKSKESIAIELKFLHDGDAVSKATDDFIKYEKYKGDSYYYAISLLEKSDLDETTNNRKEKIELFFDNELKKYGTPDNTNFFCHVLTKEKFDVPKEEG